MTFLLDTHVWIWLVDSPERFPPEVAAILQDTAQAPLGVATISAWEISKKTSLGKLSLSLPVLDWQHRAGAGPGVAMVPMTMDIAYDSSYLPGDFHRDPADQLIVATARIHGVPLITCDERILAYPHVQTLWK